MNDDSLEDPRLRSFEARLASRPPQVAPARRDELMYASAFAAGRAAAVRPLRLWKTAAAASGAMLLCMTF
ncbi:MAG TPA: hypothetical protein VGX76_19875, partial [Pirellulales bacterium]|nr:hypothetical protein [Pirellulales bacterium]